jgi:hypothetical protein
LDKDLKDLFRGHYGEWHRALGLSTIEDTYDYTGIKIILGNEILHEVDYRDGYPGCWEIDKKVYKILISRGLFITKFETVVNQDGERFLIVYTTDNPYKLILDEELYEEIEQEMITESDLTPVLDGDIPC